MAATLWGCCVCLLDRRLRDGPAFVVVVALDLRPVDARRASSLGGGVCSGSLALSAASSWGRRLLCLRCDADAGCDVRRVALSLAVPFVVLTTFLATGMTLWECVGAVLDVAILWVTSSSLWVSSSWQRPPGDAAFLSSAGTDAGWNECVLLLCLFAMRSCT